MKNTFTKILVTIAACAISCVQSFAITKITASNYSDFYIDANSYTQYIGYYAITSSADLKAFANLVNGGTNNINGVVTQTFTIDVADFTPIGTSSYPFRGIFTKYNGNIQLSASSLTATTSRQYQGLFGYNSGTIEKITFKLKNVTIQGTSYVGGICGCNTGTISNCILTKLSSSTTHSISGGSYVGGICGHNDGGTISSCTNEVTITGSSTDVGGICGRNRGTVSGCTNSGSISASAATRVGGICGFSNGSIIGTIRNNASVTGKQYVGGICGECDGGTITGRSGRNITITGESYVGGVCGWNMGTIDDATCWSNVTGGSYVGGIVGYHKKGSVLSCDVDDKDAIITSTVTSGNAYCGGICGYNAGSNEKGTISGGTVLAKVVGSATYVGGIVGCNYGDVTSVYSYNTVSGKQYVGGACGSNSGVLNNVTVSDHSSQDISPSVTASITTSESFCGGVCGANSGTIRSASCYSSTGSVSGAYEVGGVVGYNSGIVAQSHSGLTVIATSDNAYCGGVCGANSSVGCLDTCYSSSALSGKNYVGGICAYNEGKIRGCSTYRGVFTNSTTWVGGICGKNTGTIINSMFNVSDVVTMAGQQCGGICGHNTGTISDCVLGRQVSGYYYGVDITFNGQYAGGICGYNTGTITKCKTVAERDNTRGSITTTASDGYCGGICGFSTGTTQSISYCECTIPVSGTKYIGGIVGCMESGGTLSYCSNIAAVSGTFDVGGILGANYGTVDYCYNQGDITASTSQGCAGGIAGFNKASCTIKNTYSIGTVHSASKYAGALIGQNSGSITKSYYMANTATDGNQISQNGCGASSVGIVTDDNSGCVKKTYMSFVSGEVCYLLNGSVNGGSPWGQNLATDIAPELKNDKLVYQVNGVTNFFSNTEGTELPSGVASILSLFEGEGTYENPLLIPDLQMLEKFRELVHIGYNTVCGKLTADIFINENVLNSEGALREDYRVANLKVWEAINNFSGCFDGDGHTVSGMFYSNDGDVYMGLFATIKNAEIRNVTVADGFIHSYAFSGGICGKAINSYIYNCHNACVLESENGFCGGLCGTIEQTTMEQCSNSGAVMGINSSSSIAAMGGIVGMVDGDYTTSTIRECYNIGDVTASGAFAGICGFVQVQGTKVIIEKCYNTGTILSDGRTSFLGKECGGILSKMSDGYIVRNCYNTGRIVGIVAGGIVGSEGEYTLENCFNAGSVGCSTKAGGIAAYGSSSYIKNCFYDSENCTAGGIGGTDYTGSATGKTTQTLCNATLSTALNSTYSSSVWQAGTTSNATTSVISEDGVFGYKIIGTYPSLKGVGEPQVAKKYYVNISKTDVPDWISDFIPIYTIEQLKDVNNDLTKTYVLMNDVAESSNLKNGRLKVSPTTVWTPIGQDSYGFSGRFYGLNHTISGLYAESSDAYVGLFSTVSGGTVNGVKIADSKFVSTYRGNDFTGCGGIAGGASLSNAGSYPSITHCENISCSVSGQNAGGILGEYIIGGTMSYCRNLADVTGSGYVGGIVGYGSATLKYCYNEGAISGRGAYVGGLAGNTSRIESCYNLGTVSGDNVGGLSGGEFLGLTMKYSYNAGAIAEGVNIGSLTAGYSNAIDCYYDEQVSPYDGIYNAVDKDGEVTAVQTDDLCITLPENFSSEIWAIKEPVVMKGKKYLYYPYLQYFGESSAKIATYRSYNKVVLNPNGGTCTDLTEYIEREGAELPTDVVRDGYTFGGWYTNASCTSEEVTEIPVTATGEQTFYAKWLANTYTVEFENNGGVINSGNITSYSYGTYTQLPTNVTKTGYSFLGWFDNSDCEGSAISAILVTDLGNKIYYAKWDTINYTIIYNANEGEFEETPVTNYKYGDEVILPTPTREGHTFAGWYNNSNLVGSEFNEITASEFGNKEFWAKWDVNTYTVTLNADGGDINSGNLSSYTYNVLTILPQDVTKVGYTFEGWYNPENQKVTQISKGTIGDVTFMAQWTAKTYNVTLQTNNGIIGEGNNVTVYTYGVGAILPTDITKTGYEFLGWFDNSSYDGGAITEIAKNEIGNKNFWAKWKAESYKVTFDTDGGTINANEINGYTYGVGAILPTDVTKDGYTFNGWKDADDNDVLEISTADFGNKTFFAQWSIVDYTITYNSNGGVINGDYVTGYNVEDGEITLPTDVARIGYNFAGWYDNSNFEGDAVEAITDDAIGDKEFWANWERITYSVVLNANEGTIKSGNIANYSLGITTILPTEVVKTGYTFEGWYDNAGFDGERVTTIAADETGDKTFFAQWAIIDYTITYNANGGTSETTPQATYNYGNEVELPTLTREGYTFAGWFDNSNYEGAKVSKIENTETGDKEFWAKWSVNFYKVTFATNDGTINSGNIAGYVYGNGAILPQDVTKTGSNFDGWYDNAEFDGEPIVSVSETETGDKTFYAKWTANQYSITFNVNGGKINDEYATTYKYGESVVLPADVTKEGSTFEGWYTNSNGDGLAVSAIESDAIGTKVFWAIWTVNKFKVTADYDNAMGSVEGAGTYNYNRQAMLTAKSDAGYEFTGWSTESTLDGVSLQDSTIQFFVYDKIALTANFKKKEIIYAINNLIIDTLKTGVQNEPINIRDLFKSSENGNVYFSAVSTNPSLVVADVVDGKLYLTTNQFKGVAEVTVTA
ncbi:MAG: InlB B-repeat-containing protein, partial [Bacteroidales bacterium]|nr:InlB B-repeat-containing protein [Bacteroidales bacterium]